MNTSYLEGHIGLLLENMHEQGYSRKIIKRCSNMANEIIEVSQQNNQITYNDIWDNYKQRYPTKSGQYKMKEALNIVQRFAESKQFPVHLVSKRSFSLEVHSKGSLDLYPLQLNLEDLIQKMDDAGYSERSMTVARNTIKRIIIVARVTSWNNFQEIREWYKSQSYSETYLYHVLMSIDKMEYYLNYGEIDDNPLVKKERILKTESSHVGTLNLSYIQRSLPELLEIMVNNHYSKSYCDTVYLIATRILVQSQKNKWDSYADIWQWYSSQELNNNYLHDIHCVIGLLANYHLYGIIPNHSMNSSRIYENSSYSKLLPEHRELVDYVCDKQSKRGLKNSTLHHTRATLSPFLYWLQNSRNMVISEATEESIIDFVYSSGSTPKGYATCSAIRRFLEYCADIDPIYHRRALSVPKISKGRKNIQYLSSEESCLIKQTLDNPDSDLNLRDRAIGYILYYTGMRCCDIANLSLDTVDIQKKVISIIQEKTCEPLELPINVRIGNALVDYCSEERPDSEDGSLFLKGFFPYDPISKNGIWWSVKKIYKAAGIRQSKGDRQGTHIFRHRAVTTMASNEIPLPVISSMVGHTSPLSIDPYLYADFPHIKECSISLSKFPIAQEVFDNV